MSGIGTGYDYAASTFSPDGKIFQVEYALKSIDASPMILGLRCADGVVLAAEKLVTSKLYDPACNPRIMNVDTHMGFAVAGMYPDGRALADWCTEEAQDYFREYRMKVTCKYLAKKVSDIIHAYTKYAALRPFGATCMLASWNKIDGPELFCVDPSGSRFGYFGWAVGKGSQAAKTEIEKLNLDEMTVRDVVKQAARIMHVVREESKPSNDKHRLVVELSWVGEMTRGKHQMAPKTVSDEAEAFALASMEESGSQE